MRSSIPLVFLLSLLCAGCGGSVPEVAQTASVAPSAARSAEAWEQIPEEDRQAFLAVLERADPGLVDGENQIERGLRRAVYTCRDIEKDPELKGTKLAIYISERFTGGHGEVSIAEGRILAKVIRRRICPAL